ncbi:MAG: SDR family NAD(P)-dependent oxidoreductase, partial [Spirochaetia bacterium]|nr:SDR family NAD(P)-dependent oxidoreductase [Spirochaetia bacterium]
MNNLTGKTAFITGASNRLGRATAVALAEKGINTIIHFNKSEDDAAETVKLSKEKGVLSDKIQCDFKDIGKLKNLINDAKLIT